MNLNGKCLCFDAPSISEFSLYLKLETNNCARNTFSTKSSTSSIYFSTILGIRQREESIKRSDLNHSCTKGILRFAHNRLFDKSYLETLNQETAAPLSLPLYTLLPGLPSNVVLNCAHLLLLFNWSFGFL